MPSEYDIKLGDGSLEADILVVSNQRPSWDRERIVAWLYENLQEIRADLADRREESIQDVLDEEDNSLSCYKDNPSECPYCGRRDNENGDRRVVPGSEKINPSDGQFYIIIKCMMCDKSIRLITYIVGAEAV